MKPTKLLSFLVAILIGTITIVNAAWWNPTSWKIFSKNKSQVSLTTEATTVPSILSCNGVKYKACPTGQTFICPVNGEEAYCEIKKDDEIKTPKIKDSSLVAPVVKKVTLTPSKKESAPVSVKSETAVQSINKTCLNGVTIPRSEYCKKVCPDGEVVVETVACKTNVAVVPTAQQISTQTNSQNLNRGANNKAELISMLNTELAGQKKLLDDSINEVARANNILIQLTKYTGGAILDTANKLTMAYRDLFTAYQNVDTSMIQRSESIKREFESRDISVFIVSDTEMASLRKTISDNMALDSKTSADRQKQKNSYDDTMRSSIPSLNLHP